MSIRINSESTQPLVGTRVQTSTPPASLVDLSRLAQALATTPSPPSSPKSATGTKGSAQEIALRLNQSRPAPSPTAKPSASTTWGTSVWDRAVDKDVVITPPKPRFPDSVWDRAVDNDVVITPAKPRFPDSVWDRAVD